MHSEFLIYKPIIISCIVFLDHESEPLEFLSNRLGENYRPIIIWIIIRCVFILFYIFRMSLISI